MHIRLITVFLLFPVSFLFAEYDQPVSRSGKASVLLPAGADENPAMYDTGGVPNRNFKAEYLRGQKKGGLFGGLFGTNVAEEELRNEYKVKPAPIPQEEEPVLVQENISRSNDDLTASVVVDRDEPATDAVVMHKKNSESQVESVKTASDSALRVRGLYLKPELEDYWDESYGLEVQLLYEWSRNVSFALSVGFQQWQANEALFDSVIQLGPNLFEVATIQDDGEANMIPLGLSVLFDADVNERIHLELEGGIRYVFVDSDVTESVVAGLSDREGNISAVGSAEGELDYDDGIVALLGLTLGYDISEAATLFAGGGYQFDLEKGDASIDGDVLFENELEAAFGQLGLRIDL